MKAEVILLVLWPCVCITAFSLTESEYNLMPEVYHIDRYDDCQDPDSLYCYVKFTLVSDIPSPLMELIYNYSTRSHHHYDHRKLRYGICASKSCTKFLNGTKMNLEQPLEACLNETFWRTHKLKTKINEKVYCNIHQKPVLDRNAADTLVAGVCVVIVLANIAGSLSDNFFPETKNRKGNNILLAFSITRNWNKLVTPTSDTDPRIQRLQSIYGFRVISTLMVISTHAAIPIVYMAKNKQYIEEMYDSGLFRVFQCKPLSMQIFLLMSGFLMVYLGLKRAEKEPVTWGTAIKMIRMRLLRLVPTYALMVVLTATWFRKEKSPPYMQILEEEGKDCRSYWWAHLLFINNHFADSRCMLHTWYMATDTQLYCLGAVLFVMCQTAAMRRLVLPLVAATAVLLVAALTYWLDLDAIALASPEIILNMFFHYPTMQIMYMQPYSYIPGYMISFCFAYYMYHWQMKGVQEEKLEKYRPIVMAVAVGIVAVSYSSTILYEDRPRDPVLFRMLYASLAKPIFVALLAAFMAGTMFRIDRFSSALLEWRWWRNLSQLSLSVYLAHMPYVLTSLADVHTPFHVTTWTLVLVAVKTIVVSYLLAVVLWLLVEAPAGNLVDEYMKKTPQEKVNVELTKGVESNENGKNKKE